MMDEPKTLGQLVQDYLSPEGQERARKREQTYRRGYHQGWDAALEAIFGMWKADISREDAYAMSALHENALAQWRASDCTRLKEPPYFSRSQMLTALKAHRVRQNEEEV